jgi:hypothetical protein
VLSPHCCHTRPAFLAGASLAGNHKRRAILPDRQGGSDRRTLQSARQTTSHHHAPEPSGRPTAENLPTAEPLVVSRPPPRSVSYVPPPHGFDAVPCSLKKRTIARSAIIPRRSRQYRRPASPLYVYDHAGIVSIGCIIYPARWLVQCDDLCIPYHELRYWLSDPRCRSAWTTAQKRRNRLI